MTSNNKPVIWIALALAAISIAIAVFVLREFQKGKENIGKVMNAYHPSFKPEMFEGELSPGSSSISIGVFKEAHELQDSLLYVDSLVQRGLKAVNMINMYVDTLNKHTPTLSIPKVKSISFELETKVTSEWTGGLAYGVGSFEKSSTKEATSTIDFALVLNGSPALKLPTSKETIIEEGELANLIGKKRDEVNATNTAIGELNRSGLNEEDKKPKRDQLLVRLKKQQAELKDLQCQIIRNSKLRVLRDFQNVLTLEAMRLLDSQTSLAKQYPGRINCFSLELGYTITSETKIGFDKKFFGIGFTADRDHPLETSNSVKLSFNDPACP